MWLLLACQLDPVPAAPDDETGPSVEDSAEPVPEVTTEVPTAALTADEVAAEIEAALAGGMPSPLLPRKTYLESFDGRDDDCPGAHGYNLPGAFQGCTADSGWLYAGIAEYDGSTDPDEIGDFSLLADCYMVDPDGNWFVAAGELLFVRKGDANGGSVTADLSGTYSYAPAGSWMAPTGAGAVITASGQWDGGGWSVLIDGSVTDGSRAVRLDELVTNSGDCSGNPRGTYELRGEGGYWYTMDAADCGCGPVTYADGSSLGEACVDLAAVVEAWMDEVRP